jgi:hypothetical protein
LRSTPSIHRSSNAGSFTHSANAIGDHINGFHAHVDGDAFTSGYVDIDDLLANPPALRCATLSRCDGTRARPSGRGRGVSRFTARASTAAIQRHPLLITLDDEATWMPMHSPSMAHGGCSRERRGVCPLPVAGLLLAAGMYLRGLDLPHPSVDQILAATGASRSRA